MRHRPPYLPQGLNAPEKADRIPNTLNWDLFTGPAKLNPYNNVYHPGTGADGGITVQVHWEIWPAIFCTSRSEL